MSLDRPFEALLRPPVEWYSSIVSALAGSFLTLHAGSFLLPSPLANTAAGILAVFALRRFQQGYRIYRYQRNLKRMPKYAISAKQLPVSQKRLFLGRGFQWTPLHTQRLRDLDLSYNLKYRYPSALYRKARQLEARWEQKTFLKYIAHWLSADTWFNPLRPYPRIGGESCLHGVSETETNIFLDLVDRASHMVVLGTTGVGKTRLAELLIAQDIQRGDVVITLDPKGDPDLLKRIILEAKRAGREDDLVIMHLGFPEFSARNNPLGTFTKITQVATRVTNGLPSSGEAASFKGFAWRYVNLVAEALVALGVKPTYKLIHFYITKPKQLFFRYCEEILARIDPSFENRLTGFIETNTRVDDAGNIVSIPTREQAIFAYVQNHIEAQSQKNLYEVSNDLLTELFAACRLDKTYYDKITASVGPLLEKLTSGEVADLLSPNYNDLNDKRAIFDWLQVIRQKKIVYVGMDAMTDNEVSFAFGNAMLSDLVTVAGHLYNFGISHGFTGLTTKLPLPRICLHSDEFNEIIGDEFIPILNKARGAGFCVTAYTQTWSDVEARLSSKAKTGQVAGNLNSIVMFRTKEANSIEHLLSQLPKVPILRVVPASSSSDTPHGEQGIFYQSTNEDRFAHADVRLIEASDVVNLPIGQAYGLFEGGKFNKLRIPLSKEKDDTLPAEVGALIQRMRQRQVTIKEQTLH
jgi:conjugative coupling factor TraD (TOL family)